MTTARIPPCSHSVRLISKQQVEPDHEAQVRFFFCCGSREVIETRLSGEVIETFVSLIFWIRTIELDETLSIVEFIFNKALAIMEDCELPVQCHLGQRLGSIVSLS